MYNNETDLEELHEQIEASKPKSYLSQVYMTMTKKETIPLKLWLDSPEEMRIISNKRQQLTDLYEWLNYRKLKRIDTLELFAVIVIAVQGKPETQLNSKFTFQLNFT